MHKLTSSMSLVPLALLAALAAPAAARQTGGSAEPVLEAARDALGGGEALARVQALSASGTYRRVIGEREISGDLTLEVLLPDKMRRTEETGIPGGPRMSRASVLNGDQVGTEASNRGGGMFRRFGPGGPDGTGAMRAPTGEERARMRDAQARRLKNELMRYRLAWLLQSDAPVAYVATAEADDGTADVLEIRDAGNRPVRLFIDQASHRPLLLTYEAPRPRLRVARGGPPTREEIERMRREPPEIVTFEIRFDEYRKVDGVLLPHLIVQGIDGTVTEEWAIDEFEVNPSFGADTFVVKTESN